MLKKFFASFIVLLLLLFSSGMLSHNKASATLYNYGYVAHDFWVFDENCYIPGINDWLFPSSFDSSTNLELTIYATSGEDGTYMVYLQRAVNGSWITVAHAGFPRNSGKTVDFTREYNISYLYPTTPYRFVIENNSQFGLHINDIYAK